MPNGIGSWRRRENSGRFVGSRLREERRGPVFGQAKHRRSGLLWRSDSRWSLAERFGATLTIRPLQVGDAGEHDGLE
jgi:hypothetical protein